MPEQTLISFIVIAYNEEPTIAGVIASIRELDGLGHYELLVIDDGSRDDTARIVAGIASEDPRLHLIKLEHNRGRGYARRTGVAAARGELIAMIDADIVLPPDWLTRTQVALGDHAAVGGTAVPDGDVAYIYKRFRLTPRVVSGTATVAGSNGLFRRHVFEVATFDAALREGEDSALNHDMERLGLSSATVPGLLVRHEEDKTLATSLRWLFDTGRGATRQLARYGKVRQPDLATGAFVGAAGLGLILGLRRHRLLGAAVPAAFVIASSVQHVRSRFETPVALWPRVTLAVAVDSAHLTAYFAGRLAGLAELRPAPARDRADGDRSQ